jgi:hypothetical protein
MAKTCFLGLLLNPAETNGVNLKNPVCRNILASDQILG